MIRRESNQSSLADALVRRAGSTNPTFDKIDLTIDWTPVRNLIETRYRTDGPGRPAYAAITLFKALLLQNWYNLSDPQLEESIADRLSFRKFIGINLDENVPDYSTIHRFRDRIAPIIPQLFELVNKQLEHRRLILKKGTLVDASLVKSFAREPNSGQAKSDPEATWTRKKKGGKPFYGYKAHVGVDQESGLIRQVDLTTGKISDVDGFKAMVTGDEEAVYADKGYFGRTRSDWLKAKGIKDRIMVQKNRHHPMPAENIAFNESVKKIRSAVERIFGILKRHYKYERCRYRSLARNRCHLFVLCTCYNLKRSVKLSPAC